MQNPFESNPHTAAPAPAMTNSPKPTILSRFSKTADGTTKDTSNTGGNVDSEMLQTSTGYRWQNRVQDDPVNLVGRDGGGTGDSVNGSSSFGDRLKALAMSLNLIKTGTKYGVKLIKYTSKNFVRTDFNSETILSDAIEASFFAD